MERQIIEKETAKLIRQEIQCDATVVLSLQCSSYSEGRFDCGSFMTVLVSGWQMRKFCNSGDPKGRMSESEGIEKA